MIDRQGRKASRQRKVQRKRQRGGRENEERGRINLGGIYCKHNLLNRVKKESEGEN